MFKKTYFYSGHMYDQNGERRSFFSGQMKTRSNAIHAMSEKIDELKSKFPENAPHFTAFNRCD